MNPCSSTIVPRLWAPLCTRVCASGPSNRTAMHGRPSSLHWRKLGLALEEEDIGIHWKSWGAMQSKKPPALLSGHPPLSDARGPASSSPSDEFTVHIEQLSPARGLFLDCKPSTRIAHLKIMYIQAIHRDETQRLRPRDLRFIFNGTILKNHATAGQVGLTDESSVCAFRVPRRRTCCLLRHVTRWWPVCLALSFITGSVYEIFAQKTSTHGDSSCNRLLIIFNFVGFALTILYAIVLSGMFQDNRGRRLMWPMRQSDASAALSVFVMLLSLTTFISGSVWLFHPGHACQRLKPHIWYPALVLWILLLLFNIPWLVLVLLPLLILCKFEAGFAIVAFLSGCRGNAMESASNFDGDI